jgi:ketosteroid isomerase-like protein
MKIPMKHFSLLLVVVGILAGCAAPHSVAAAAGPAEEEVMGITQAICDAFRKRDLPALEQLLAPEFTLVGTDSVVQPRAQAISEVQAGEPHYEVFQNHDMAARVYGQAAVVQGITSLRGTSAGKPFAVDVRFTDTLIKSEGHWRIVVSHVTRIPAKQ